MKKEFLKFKQITSKHNLASNTVNTITQDREGFLWFGCQEGFNRYDGNNLKLYRNKIYDSNGIPDNFISIIYEDNEKDLWIGTTKAGLIMYDKCGNKFIKEKVLEYLSKDFIISIVEDKNNNIYLSTFKNGLYKLNKNSKVLEKINLNLIFNEENKNFNQTKKIIIDNIDNKLYFSTINGGLYRIDLMGDKNITLSDKVKKDKLIINNSISALFQDSDRNIWIGTINGLKKFCMKENKFESYEHDEKNVNSISGNNISCFCEDKHGNVWIGTYNGLNKYNKSENNFVHYSIKEDFDAGFVYDSIKTLFIDKTEVLWIGTAGAGLLVSDTIQKKFYSITNYNKEHKFTESNLVTSIYLIDKNDIFIGTMRDGLYRLKIENNKKTFIKHSEINDGTIRSIVNDGKGNLWITNSKFGLCRINLTDNSTVFIDKIINESTTWIKKVYISKYHKDLIFMVCYDKGIKLLKTNKMEFMEVYLPSNINSMGIQNIYFDSENYLWIGTEEKETFVIKNFLVEKTSTPISDNKKINCHSLAWCVHEDHMNNIWIGTSSNGLYKINLDKNSVCVYNEEKGLIDNNVLGILEDENNNLWLSTTNAISRFNLIDKSFRSFDASDGFNNIEFTEAAYFKYFDGTMYFGGDNGITFFKPEELLDNPYIPNIVFTDFQVFNKSVLNSPTSPILKKSIIFTREINLTYKENVFSFEFAALIFNNTEKNQYAYKMEGFDKDWTYCGTRRKATYTNLDPGEYIFRVKGSNNDGVWNEEGTSIKINISPPFWKTWWFKGLGVLGAVAATGYTFNQRVEKIKNEKRLQEDFSRKLIESQENDRKRIASELHDSLGQDLAVIKNKAIMSMKKASDKKFKEQMSEISEITTNAMNEVKEISYNLRPYELDRLGLIKTLKSLVERAGKTSNINFTCDIDNIDKIFDPEVEINIYRIIQECLTNIIKHSNATEVSVYLKKLSNNVTIFISDNGKGFDINKIYSKSERIGFGLRGIPERVKLFGGNFKIESEPGMGTKINISIPVLN